MIDRSAKQRLHGIDHALAARGKTVDAVAGAVPQRDTRRRTLGIGAIDHVVAHQGILLHRGEQKTDFLAIVHAGNDDKSVPVIGSQLGLSHD